MAAVSLRMSRFLLALILIVELTNLIECTNSKDPDDYDDLEEEDEIDSIFAGDDDAHADKLANDRPKPGEKLTTERYLRLIRPRLGHFERYPELRKLYEDYFEKSIKTRDASLSKISKAEDWRYLRPTPDFCVSFLGIFKSKKYMINKPFDIIPLDACLEWVFLNETTVEPKDPDYERQERAVSERELDMKQTQSSYTLSMEADLRSDITLKSIYEETLFGIPDKYENVNGKRVLKEPGVPRRMRLKLKKYLLRLLDINNQNPGKGCHSLWLDAYTSFMEQVYLDCGGQSDCDHFGDQLLDEDRYFRLVAESTRLSSINCYKTMQSSILSLMRDSYDKKMGSVILSRAFLLTKGKVERQYESQKWSREMVKILQLVSGQEADKAISLGEVARKLWEIKSGDDDESNRFLEALGSYAIANIDIKATEADSQGVKRYARATARLCKPYIDEKIFLAKAGAIDEEDEEEANQEPFLFYHLIYSLIRLTNHESIYDITKDQFELEVLKNQWEALYLTTLACQMMSATQGELSQSTNENAFEVSFRYDSVKYFEDWPLEIMYQKLAKVAGKPDQSAVVQLKRPKLDFRAKVNKATKDLAEDEDEAGVGVGVGVGSWSDDASDDEDEDEEAHHTKVKKDKGSSRRHTGKSISDYGDALSSKLKKTFGRFRLGGSTGKNVSPKKGAKSFMMTEDQIRQYFRNYGRWPDLPDNIRQYYPNLPVDCVKKQEESIDFKATPTQQQQSYLLQKSPAEQRRDPKQVGYWSTNWSPKDDLPAWGNNEPEIKLPPRRSPEDMF